MGIFEKILYKFIKNDGVAFVLSVFVVALLYMHFKSMSSIIDYPVFSSVIITMLFNRIVDLLKNIMREHNKETIFGTTDDMSFSEEDYRAIIVRYRYLMSEPKS